MARNWSITEAHCNHQVDSTPRLQDHNISTQPRSKHIPAYHMLRTTKMAYHQQAKYHLKLAAIMCNHNQFKACLILCDWALASMIKALYIHKYHSVHPPKELTMNEILPLVHTDTELGLDLALFIGTMQHMSSLEDCPHDQPLKLNNIESLIQRTEEILDELSARLMRDSSE
ncbi:HEPN domain-containing protein [Paenibacillus xylanexedens]|uniref:HEPN domain-containing protein n=1 Tax=Paenibacillus xylanexedens TaxID=528191 RepID=UPI001F2DBA1C|nr:HEPN domain-containing protein [Paenibacillus xylanexedens]MCF7756411.1 HEPN domain-containing protein [Paenibacillus xylanexedens]